ncbi:CDP-alcohol phosphatidyltransferase family protein [Dokdonia sp. Hel_I_53]|uniref:CDP-alcohol phosphatidyltransferase family protein n=1 Tax=Dokdonia sp. Hel_I_53 TaxID=1566287 RepID=UPI001199524D|nr:CDP-alcohol phosphatidyltransferase family protein [Dokdonia sp. Hel_I_53]TVZ53422.1 CDP-diacylglycerol--serine O-phosphatidyltransferase [Dokdonia sp. Hel_I_53]
MSINKYVPNAITMGNLLSGCIAVVFAVNDRLEYAAIFVALGIFFDFFDGFFARILNASSEVGLQLDSLADMVTSGVVPGVVMYQLLEDASDVPWGAQLTEQHIHLGYFGFAITLASAYRLAKFNVDDRQTSSFIGLPTPANTLFILSLPLILIFEEYAFAKAVLENPYVLLAITALSCFMLNAELPLFALKFKTWSFAENKVRYLFLLASVLLLVFFQFSGIPLLIILYILLSIIFKD